MIGVQTSLPSNLAIAPALPFYGPINLIRRCWTSQGAILPYFLHGLLAATLLLALALALAPAPALALVLWNRGSAVRSPATAAKVSAPAD